MRKFFEGLWMFLSIILLTVMALLAIIGFVSIATFEPPKQVIVEKPVQILEKDSLIIKQSNYTYLTSTCVEFCLESIQLKMLQQNDWWELCVPYGLEEHLRNTHHCLFRCSEKN